MMSEDHFPTFDEENDCIRLNGGRAIMRTLLLKAKFGEALDPETLFHPSLSRLLREIAPEFSSPDRPKAQFAKEFMTGFAEAVYFESSRSGWWSMDSEQRTDYLQNAIAPYVFAPDEIELIIERVEDRLFIHRRVVHAADNG